VLQNLLHQVGGKPDKGVDKMVIEDRKAAISRDHSTFGFQDQPFRNPKSKNPPERLKD